MHRSCVIGNMKKKKKWKMLVWKDRSCWILHIISLGLWSVSTEFSKTKNNKNSL